MSKNKKPTRAQIRKNPLIILRLSLSDKVAIGINRATQLYLRSVLRIIRDDDIFTINESDFRVFKERIKYISEVKPYLLQNAKGGFELSVTHITNEIKGKSLIAIDPNSFQTRADLSGVDNYLATTSKNQTKNFIKLVKDSLERGLKEGLSTDDIAKLLFRSGIATAKWKAKQIAKTAAIWSHNFGAKEGYTASGVEVLEWLATEDDITCPFCMAMDGIQIPSNKSFLQQGQTVEVDIEEDGETSRRRLTGPSGLNFDINHPPLHPNCRCTILPVV